MTLINDISQIRYNSVGADLITQSQALRQQLTNTQNEISSLRPKIKADVANEIWSLSDISRLVDLIRLRDSINAQLTRTKIEIQSLRTVIENQAYHNELLAEENLIP